MAIVADAKEALSAITAELQGYKSQYKDEIAAAKAEYKKIVDDLYSAQSPDGLVQTTAFGIINEFMGENDVAVGSSGSLPGDLQRLFRPKNPRTYHVEYGFSNMGYEVNAALGAKLAWPKSDVYSFCGDGSYIMAHSELFTAVQEKAKIVVCLFDNSGWGCIENLQNNQGTDTFGTVFAERNSSTNQLDGPRLQVDFAKNAESYGAKGYTVRTGDELKAALEDAKKQTVPVLIDIKVVPKTMSEGFESWWRVGVAEVSKSHRVAECYKDMQANIAKTRDY